MRADLVYITVENIERID